MTTNTGPEPSGETPEPPESIDPEGLKGLEQRLHRELETEEDPAKQMFTEVDEALHPDDS